MTSKINLFKRKLERFKYGERSYNVTEFSSEPFDISKIGKEPPLELPMNRPTKRHRARPTRARGSVSWQVKVTIWDRFMGNVKHGPCLLCGQETIRRNKNYGFEAAHIIASKYCNSNTNSFLLVPSCSTCNNEMGTSNLFDWLHGLGRISALRKIAWIIFQAFAEEFPEEMSFHNHLASSVFAALYANERKYPDGGTIINRAEILRVVSHLQYTKLLIEQKRLLTELRKKAEIAERILEQGH